MAIDYEQAKVLLNNSYEKAAQELPAAVTQYITDNKDALDTIFFSKTQKPTVPNYLIVTMPIPKNEGNNSQYNHYPVKMATILQGKQYRLPCPKFQFLSPDDKLSMTLE